MADVSVVPVDHQPDFSDVSLVPVDHEPFSADDMIEKARAQLESQPSRFPMSYETPEADQAAMQPETYVNPVVKNLLGSIATLPQRAIDASIADVEHYRQYGMSTDYVPQSLGPAVETALMTTGGPGIVPAGKILSGRGVAGDSVAGIGRTGWGGSRGRGTVAEGPEAPIAKGELPASAPTGNFYSVLSEIKLKPTSYPGRWRPAHFQEANENLLQEMEVYADYARMMQDALVDLRRTPAGLAPRISPAGFTWHHAEEPGVMQLVPREQHKQGSIFQDILHPNGRGGFSKWGK